MGILRTPNPEKRHGRVRRNSYPFGEIAQGSHLTQAFSADSRQDLNASGNSVPGVVQPLHVAGSRLLQAARHGYGTCKRENMAMSGSHGVLPDGPSRLDSGGRSPRRVDPIRLWRRGYRRGGQDDFHSRSAPGPRLIVCFLAPFAACRIRSAPINAPWS